MSKVTKKKPNEFMKKLNQFSNKMFEKSTGLVAPNTSEYEDEPYSYNSPAPSSVYIQQSSGTQYVRQSVSFTNAFRAGFFFYIRLHGGGNYSVYYCLYDFDGVFTATNSKICSTNTFD